MRKARWGRIDILHNNVGVSLSGGDAELLDIIGGSVRPLRGDQPEELRAGPPST